MRAAVGFTDLFKALRRRAMRCLRHRQQIGCEQMETPMGTQIRANEA